MDREDLWERLEHGKIPFRWYFEGESIVTVADVSALCDWLRGCEYINDQAIFHEPAWVVFQHEGAPYLLEATAKHRER